MSCTSLWFPWSNSKVSKIKHTNTPDFCRGCFLVFFLRFLPSSVRAASYYIYVRARGRGLHGWRARITHRGRGWFLPWGLMVDPLRPPASSPLKRGQRRNAGGIIDGRRVVVPDDPRRAGLILQAGGVLVPWVERSSRAAGAAVLVVAPVVEGVPEEGREDRAGVRPV